MTLDVAEVLWCIQLSLLFLSVCVCPCVCVFFSLCVCVCVLFVCMYVCMYVCVYMCMYMALCVQVPPFVLAAMCLVAYRIHSIFVLRLFNDPLAMILLYLAVNLFVSGRWTTGCAVFR